MAGILSKGRLVNDWELWLGMTKQDILLQLIFHPISYVRKPFIVRWKRLSLRYSLLNEVCPLKGWKTPTTQHLYVYLRDYRGNMVGTKIMLRSLDEIFKSFSKITVHATKGQYHISCIHGGKTHAHRHNWTDPQFTRSPQGIHLTWFKSFWLKSWEKSVCCNLNIDDPIMLQFCTCHDSWVVVASAKLWHDWTIIFHMRATYVCKNWIMSS